MSVITILAIIAIIGIVAWMLNGLPIDATIKKVLQILLIGIAAILVVAWLAAALGHPFLHINI